MESLPICKATEPVNFPPMVLILDDQASVRRLVGRAVSHFLTGSTVVEAACNVEALEKIESRSVTAIIQDYQRIGETALDFALALRSKLAELPPTIVYSGTGVQEIQMACRSQGVEPAALFSAIIPKSDTAALVEAVQRLLSEASDLEPSSTSNRESEDGEYPFQSSFEFLQFAWMLQQHGTQISFPEGNTSREPGFRVTLPVSSASEIVGHQLECCLREIGGASVPEGTHTWTMEFESIGKRDDFIDEFQKCYAAARSENFRMCGMSPFEMALYHNNATVVGQGGRREDWRVVIECGYSGHLWELAALDHFLIAESGFLSRDQRGRSTIWENLELTDTKARISLHFPGSAERDAWVEGFEARAACVKAGRRHA